MSKLKIKSNTIKLSDLEFYENYNLDQTEKAANRNKSYDAEKTLTLYNSNAKTSAFSVALKLFNKDSKDRNGYIVVGIDIDDPEISENLIHYIKDNNLDQTWVYSINPAKPTLHLYFKTNQKNTTKHANKFKDGTIDTLSGIPIEFKTTHLTTLRSDYEYSAPTLEEWFGRELPELPLIFTPYRKEGGKDWTAPSKSEKGVSYYISKLKGARDGDRRKNTLFQYLRNRIKHIWPIEDKDNWLSEMELFGKYINEYVFEEQVDNISLAEKVYERVLRGDHVEYEPINQRAYFLKSLVENHFNEARMLQWNEMKKNDVNRTINKIYLSNFADYLISLLNIRKYNGEFWGLIPNDIYIEKYRDYMGHNLSLEKELIEINTNTVIYDIIDRIVKLISEYNYEYLGGTVIDWTYENFKALWAIVTAKAGVYPFFEENDRLFVRVKNALLELKYDKYVDDEVEFNAYLTNEDKETISELNNDYVITNSLLRVNYDPSITENAKIDVYMRNLVINHSIMDKKISDRYHKKEFEYNDKEVDRLVDLLWEICAVSIVPSTFLRKFIVLLGEGSNGKSTFTKVLQRFIGETNFVAKSRKNLESNFGLSGILNKTLIVQDEGDNKVADDVGILKQLAAGEIFSADVKHKNPIEFKSTAALMILSNYTPRVPGFNNAILDRILTIQFRTSFKGKKAIKAFETVILDTPEDYSYFLNKCLSALQRLMKNSWNETPTYELITNKMKFVNDNNRTASWLLVNHYASFEIDYNKIVENGFNDNINYALELTPRGINYFQATSINKAHEEFAGYFREEEGSGYSPSLATFQKNLTDALKVGYTVEFDDSSNDAAVLHRYLFKNGRKLSEVEIVDDEKSSEGTFV